MTLLTLKDLKKHFGSQEVLRGASLTIDPGSKVGIVGRNGGGKTTLFRMITGEEHPDWGSITLRKKARLGFVPQRPTFGAGITVRGYVESGLDEVRELIARFEKVGEDMGHASGDELERLMRQHDELNTEIESLGGWDTERATDTVLSGIGLKTELWEREARTLSGGEKNRVLLARELVCGHDLLLLDEPTNHLDIEGIEWLEKYLHELQGAVLIISHDRRLLQNGVGQILEMEYGQLTSYPGNYSKYIQLKAERYETDKRAYDQQQEFLKKEDSFIKKHMGSQRTAEAKGRAKKLSAVVRLEQPHHDVRRPVIKAPEAVRGGELVLKAEGLTGGYTDNVLFENVDVRIGRGQRIGVVGPNGAGKTTLIKIIADRLQALAGTVELGHGAVGAYYDQDTSFLRQDGTPFSEIYRHYPEMVDVEIRSHLALFLFRGKDVDKPVPALSGGERARLALAILVLTKPSWMALDEPTNHLDLASRTALEEMLGSFQGALLCVSHDREFLDGLCDHMIEVSDGQVREHAGNYTSWRNAREEEQFAASEARAKAAAEAKKRAAQDAEKAKKKATKSKGPRNPYMFEKLEKRIMKLEGKLESLHAACATEDVFRDADKLRDKQYQIAEVEAELEEANETWANWD
ncbi:MAG: ABC-F family ATP-binding cassette domain-containing protein [bacterium]|nr:ABC-F family ATP-binding cassette domain-containing protein [bacterium]